jgi:deoxyribose-phosphate aldolase
MTEPFPNIPDEQLARIIDLTLLKPEASPIQITELCTEAKRYGFYAVCVNPVYVELATKLLKGSSVIPITVVGFPLGASDRHIKGTEAGVAIMHGAKEIDMVIRIDALKWNDDKTVVDDIAMVVQTCRPLGIPVKVILETAMLTSEEIVRGCRLAEHAGAQFVKTSTGFPHAGGGATHSAVALMHQTVGGRLGIKASGGIKTRQQALGMLAHGATRIGASSGAAIMRK